MVSTIGALFCIFVLLFLRMIFEYMIIVRYNYLNFEIIKKKYTNKINIQSYTFTICNLKCTCTHKATTYTMRTLHMQYAHSILSPIHMHTYIITRYVTVKHCTCIFIYTNSNTYFITLTHSQAH